MPVSRKARGAAPRLTSVDPGHPPLPDRPDESAPEQGGAPVAPPRGRAKPVSFDESGGVPAEKISYGDRAQ
jgi:hypothetical protein